MKRKRIIMSLCLVLAMAMSFTACSKTDNDKGNEGTKVEESAKSTEEGGLMVLGIGSDPTIVNPLYADDRVSLTIAHVLFDPLYDVEKGEIVYNGLAKSMEHTEDFLTYTLKLRDDVKWHDGKDVTAEDMIFTMDSILDEKQNAKGKSALTMDDKAIEYNKVDDYTIEFKLPQVNMSFVQNLAGIKPIPKHIFEGAENIAESPANSEPIGNGSFKFKEHKTGELYQVEKNKDYYGDKALLDGIAYRVIPDANASLVALENGEISAYYIKSNEVDKFKNNDNLELVTFSEGMVNNLFFRVSNEKVNDKKVRQAISYAIDKDKIINGVYQGTEYATPAYSPFAQETQFYTEEVEQFKYNPEKAKELLKEAGVENLKLRMMYNSGSPAQEKECLLIQEMLKEVGIEIELLPMERGTFIEKLLNPDNMDFEIATNGYVMGDNPDEYGVMFSTGNAENFSGYSNPKVDELFKNAKTEKDEAKRGEMYKEIQQIIVEDAVQYPTAYVKSIVAVNKEFKNLEEAKPAPIHMFDNFNKISKSK